MHLIACILLPYVQLPKLDEHNKTNLCGKKYFNTQSGHETFSYSQAAVFVFSETLLRVAARIVTLYQSTVLCLCRPFDRISDNTGVNMFAINVKWKEKGKRFV